MHARSALFDLLGDHVRPRGGQAPVAALVRLLAPLDVSAAAVRTAVSRMVRQGWLRPVTTTAGPGYAVTGRALARLDDAARRIYRTDADAAWDGGWDLLVLEPVRARATRERLRAELGFLGYAPLHPDTWVAARASGDVGSTLAAAGARARHFVARPDGDPRVLARELYDLDALAAAYRRWQDDAVRELARAVPAAGSDDERDFARRSLLLHGWRKFLFRDPGLPAELLPPDWPGREAAAFFDAEAQRLAPAASRFVDSCLAGPT